MTRLYAIALAATGLALTSCSGTATPPPPVTPVVAAEAALAAAGHIVLGCYAVPACVAVAPKPAIKKAYDAAYNAVTAAQTVADAGGSPDMTAATAAMSGLQSLIDQLPAT